MATKGDVLRSELKEAIKEADFREKKDRPKTLKRGNKSAPKKLDFDSSEKNLRKEFDLRFDNPKFEDKKPKRVPGEQKKCNLYQKVEELDTKLDLKVVS